MVSPLNDSKARLKEHERPRADARDWQAVVDVARVTPMFPLL